MHGRMPLDGNNHRVLESAMSINGIETIISLASPTIRTSTKFMASSIANIDKKDILSVFIKVSLIVICLTRIRVSRRMDVNAPLPIAHC